MARRRAGSAAALIVMPALGSSGLEPHGPEVVADLDGMVELAAKGVDLTRCHGVASGRAVRSAP